MEQWNDFIKYKLKLDLYNENNYSMNGYAQYILCETDMRVLQYLRECSLDIDTTLTYDEYIQLERLRQHCVEIIRNNTND